jgi:hypothetical protein
MHQGVQHSIQSRLVYITMNIEDDDEASVTVHRLYEQLVETLNLAVQIPAMDSGERAGKMFRGFEFLPPKKQLVLLRQEFRRPYVAPEVRKWMYSNDISSQEVTSLVWAQGVFIEDDKERCRLIDFDHWADVNEKLRQQGATLPCDVETGWPQPSAINTYRPRIDGSEDHNISTRQNVGFLAACTEVVMTGLAVFGNYFFSQRPRSL